MWQNRSFSHYCHANFRHIWFTHEETRNKWYGTNRVHLDKIDFVSVFFDEKHQSNARRQPLDRLQENKVSKLNLFKTRNISTPTEEAKSFSLRNMVSKLTSLARFPGFQSKKHNRKKAEFKTKNVVGKIHISLQSTCLVRAILAPVQEYNN